MLCISGQKRNKDNPIEQLKHFLGKKGFSENQHSNHVQFKPRIGDNLVAQSRGEYSPLKVMGVLVGKVREHP